MKKTIFVLVMVAIVAVVLAGGTAFIIQQNKNSQLKRLGRQAEEKLEAKDYTEAVSILKKIEADGGTPQSAFLYGKALYEQGKPREGIKYFQKITERWPNSSYYPDALLYQGRYSTEVESRNKKAKDTFIQIIDKFPDQAVADFALLYLSKISYDEGDVAQAKKNLDQLVKRSDSAARGEAEFLLGDINMKQLRSPDAGPGDDIYTIRKGDSIWKLERQLKVPGNLLMGINNLRSNALTVGQQIKVPRLEVSVLIDKAQRTLTLKNHNQFLKKYRAGINVNDKMVPSGEYTVQALYDKGYEYTDTEANKSYRAGDSENPLGTRFIQLRRELGIHGTNQPDKVGTYIPKGYIALTNQDVEEIFTFMKSGNNATPVSIKNHNVTEGDSTESK